MLTKITKRAVEALPVGATDVFIWDIALKGFGLKVTPKGKRVFVLQYYAPKLHRVRRRMTLGVFGPLTVDKARAAAQQLLGRVAAGADPAFETHMSNRATQEATVSVLSTIYLDEVRAKLKPRTAAEYARMFTVYIVPAIGRKPLADLAFKDVVTLHLAYREHPYQANRILQLLKAFCYWAE